jgi:hypothetical protein
MLASKADAGDDVRGAGTSRDERGTPVDDPVEDDARCVVTRLVRRE